MPESATRVPAGEEELPSLDPATIEHAYLRERTRRYARDVRREYARNSNARFYVALAVLLFLTVLLALGALREIQRTFGI